MTETIDILIPVYNCEKYLTTCITSLLNQTYKNINIIAVDDGSNDKSKEILKEFKAKNENVSIFYKENENNISKTRNFLLGKITSKYFTFFDADDYAEPTYIEKLYKNLKNFDADISICAKLRHKNKRKLKTSKKNLLKIFNKEDAILEMVASKYFNGTVYCKHFKTTLLNDIKFNENIHYGEDLDFCYKIMQNASKIVYSNERLYHYIIRSGSIVTSKFNTNKLTCLDSYQNIIDNSKENKLINIHAKAMQGLLATELLYYVWRDKFKSKNVKKILKNNIKYNITYIKKAKHLPLILKLSPLVLWLAKFM